MSWRRARWRIRCHVRSLPPLSSGSSRLAFSQRMFMDGPAPPRAARSEEHTSELQSRQYLVCRLLLEKKKKTIYTITKNKKSNNLEINSIIDKTNKNLLVNMYKIITLHMSVWIII